MQRALMCQPIAKGGRGVPNLLWKTMAILIAFHAELVIHPPKHLASCFARYWLGFPLRSLAPLARSSPWTLERPWHYERMAQVLEQNPGCLEGGLVHNHRHLYDLFMQNQRVPSTRSIVGREVSWEALQPAFLEGEARDLNWLGALGRLPVRERLYRFGCARTPLCPVGCGQEETVEHVFWTCPCTQVFWGLVKEWWRKGPNVPLNNNLIRFGGGLEALDPEKRKMVWEVVSEGKRAVWGWRGKCLRAMKPRMEPGAVFRSFLGRVRWLGERQEAWRRYGEAGRSQTGAPRAGVG